MFKKNDVQKHFIFKTPTTPRSEIPFCEKILPKEHLFCNLSCRSVCDDTQNLNETFSDTKFFYTESDTFFDTKFFRYRNRNHLNKLAKARKTRTSPSTLGLKKFGPGKLRVQKV